MEVTNNNKQNNQHSRIDNNLRLSRITEEIYNASVDGQSSRNNSKNNKNDEINTIIPVKVDNDKGA